MSQAIIGIGIPGSGKTTYLKPLAARMGLPYVSLDDIRQELTGDAADHGQHARTLAVFWQRIAAALVRGPGVVIDTTNSKARDRREVLGFCRRHGVDDITGIWFDTPLEVCLGRNRGRDRQVPEHALHRMQARLDAAPPTESEGFDRLEVRHD